MLGFGYKESVAMSHEFLVLIETDEDGFLVASVLNIQGCHTQAKTMPELLKRIKEAIELCIKARTSAAV